MTERKKEIDEPTGVELNEHEWDGLRELNNPLPRWWLYLFYASIVFSLIYMVLYPAIPLLSTYTSGLLGMSQRETVQSDVAELKATRAEYGAGLTELPISEIRANESLLEFSLAAGAAAFGDNCATCHGRGGEGFTGYPNLNDDEWLWGGTFDEIYTTLLYGIRWTGENTRMSQMPAFGKDGLLEDDQIDDLVEYVVHLSGREADQSAVSRAKPIYDQQCAFCHQESGKGDQSQGAPNLTNAIWLYGGDRESLKETIYYSRAGQMPSWEGRLDDMTIRALSVYVHSLGGGEEEGERRADLR